MTDFAITFHVGKKRTCCIRILADAVERGAVELLTEWRPNVPRRLSRAEMRDYRRGRDALLAEVSDFIGGNVLVIEP